MASGAHTVTLARLQEAGGLSKRDATQLLHAAATLQGRSAPEAWSQLLTVLSPDHDFRAHELLFHATYSAWNEEERGPAPCWSPSRALQQSSSAARFMATLPGFTTTHDCAADFRALHSFSVESPEAFWQHFVRHIGLTFSSPPTQLLDFDPQSGLERWFVGAKLNMAEACFSRVPEGAAAVVWTTETDPTVRQWSVAELRERCCLLANGWRAAGVERRGRVAAVMPMTAESVGLYLSTILAGCAWISIAESCAPPPAVAVHARPLALLHTHSPLSRHYALAQSPQQRSPRGCASARHAAS